MREAVFRFHDELNDFLSTERRDREVPHSFLLPASIKDMIEALALRMRSLNRCMCWWWGPAQ